MIAETKLKLIGTFVIALFIAILFASTRLGGFDYFDRKLNELRFSIKQQPASGDIVFVAIDKRALDGVGVWPWPRDIYGKLVDTLVDAGARDIFFNIDFSAKSNDASDAAFANALKRASQRENGSVIFASFLQNQDGYQMGEISANLPIAQFSQYTKLGLVNVVVDSDGLVRSFPYSLMVNGAITPSAASLLSGKTGQVGRIHPINFSIEPNSIPRFSVLDLLEGKIDVSMLEGKNIVIGADAIELGDYFNVPKAGIVSGSILQILGTETLAQDIIPHIRPLGIAILILGCLAIASLWLKRNISLKQRIVFAYIFSISIEAGGIYAWYFHSTLLQTAPIHLIGIAICMWSVVRDINIKQLLLTNVSIEKENTEQILGQVIKDNTSAIIIVNESGNILYLSDYARILLQRCQASHAHMTRKDVDMSGLDEIFGDANVCIKSIQQGTPKTIRSREVMIKNGYEDIYLEYSITPSCLSKATQKGLSNNNHDITAADSSIIACITAQDVTHKIEQAQQIKYIAQFDTLTKAQRRHSFISDLRLYLRDQRNDTAYTIFALNIHRFKTINLTLGREVGDRLLQQFVERIREMKLTEFHIASAGGDNFLFVINRRLADAEIDEIYNAILAYISRPFDLGGVSAKVGLRMGVSINPQGSSLDAAIIVNQAELALDEARKTSGNGLVIFDRRLSDRQERSRTIERELWRAVERGEIYNAYQPQVDMKDGRLIGVEALVRWEHPELGRVSPEEFIAIAEANGYIEQLGRFILEQACADAMNWPDHISVAVNVAPLQLVRGDLYKDVAQALEASNLEAHRLHLEITESGFVESSEIIIDTLERVKSLGVLLAIDDFGTGYSSFGYLSSFPMDKIKIDQFFIRNLLSDEANPSIVQSIKTLADGLEKKLICEGVETKEHVDFLRMMGIKEAQGYYYSKPVSAREIKRMVDTTLPRTLASLAS